MTDAAGNDSLAHGSTMTPDAINSWLVAVSTSSLPKFLKKASDKNKISRQQSAYTYFTSSTCPAKRSPTQSR